MNDVYIAGGLRSYIGVYNGMYRHVPAEKLGAAVLQEVIRAYGLVRIDEIIGGNSVGCGGNITRLAALEAGLDVSVPAVTVDMQCCSGLESIAIAAAKVASGQAECILAGGFDSASTQPRRSCHPNHPAYRGDENWYMTAQFSPQVWSEDCMLRCAEYTAEQFQITREMLDAWVLRSHALAGEAVREGVFQPCIAPVWGGARDEGIRPAMRPQLLRRLKPVLPDGTVITAANACLTNDGAAFVIVCSPAYARRYGLQPAVKIRGVVSCGTDPLLSPVGAVQAAEAVLTRCGLRGEDIDIFEINEAFALIGELFARQFPRCVAAYNPFGGALAYGHPYGATGAVLLLHAIEGLRARDGALGCCSIAGAGGLGKAMIIERV